MAADALALPPSRDETGGKKLGTAFEGREEDQFYKANGPLKYIPLCDLYSATTPCVAGLKKAKAAARKPALMNSHDQLKKEPITVENCNQIAIVYSRRRQKKATNFLEGLLRDLDVKSEELEDDGRGDRCGIKRKRVETRESHDQTSLSDGRRKNSCKDGRGSRNISNIINSSKKKKRKNDSLETDVTNSEALRTKKWVWLSFEGVDPKKFIGLLCKVYWPLDASWYSGHLTGYNSESGRHHVKYEDGEEENLALSKERIKFYVSVRLWFDDRRIPPNIKAAPCPLYFRNIQMP